MLPTPDTFHVPYDRVYEPAEDSFLMLDTLSSPTETAFLQERFGRSSSSPSSSSSWSPPPLVVEIGSGSGVVLAFVSAQSRHLFGHGRPLLTLAVDVNEFACRATAETVSRAQAAERAEQQQRLEQKQKQKQKQSQPDGGDRSGGGMATFLGAARADLVSALRPGEVDVLLFNPPYVPTPEMPRLPDPDGPPTTDTFARDSHLLELAYAGGLDGMETTDRLLAALPAVLAPRGCAYLLLCAQNRPEAVKERIRAWSLPGERAGWRAETVGSSGKQAGWEKLQIVRIWRE